MEKAVDRQMPHKDDIDKAIEQRCNERYTTEKGAAVDYFSAISLVNRYCASLPSDIFTKPAIQWGIVKDTNFMVNILLPIQSPCKDEIRVRQYYHLSLNINYRLISWNSFVIFRVKCCLH